MRICVYGAGAMGTGFGAMLSRVAACDLVSRNTAHIAALKEKGATLNLNGAELVWTKVSALLPEELHGEYDLIVLATKQRENAQTAEFLSRFLKADGALVTVQNGLPEAGLAEVLGADRVYGGVLSWGAELAEGGVVRVTSSAGFRIGLGAYGKGERLQEIADLFGQAFTVSTGNLVELRFAKLATNASFSTLSVISGLTFGEIAKRHKKYAIKLIRETFAVARACGCKNLPLNGHNLFRVLTVFGGLMLPVAMKKYRNTRSGMLKDLERGKRCDVDFVAGAVISEGKKRGVKTPCLERAVALVHEIENGLAESAPETLELFKETGVGYGL